MPLAKLAKESTPDMRRPDIFRSPAARDRAQAIPRRREATTKAQVVRLHNLENARLLLRITTRVLFARLEPRGMDGGRGDCRFGPTGSAEAYAVSVARRSVCIGSPRKLSGQNARLMLRADPAVERLLAKAQKTPRLSKGIPRTRPATFTLPL